MITKIIPWDVFSTKLQPWENEGKPINLICWTNQTWVNKSGVAHDIGNRFNASFLNLLADSEVPLWHVFSWEWMIEQQSAMFHAIAVNRKSGDKQDWSELLGHLTTGFNQIHLQHSLRNGLEAGDDLGSIDRSLRDEIAGLDMREGGDHALKIARTVQAHIAKTRHSFRVVLIGGCDWLKHEANLQDTLEAMESSDLLLHLYLWYDPAQVQAVQKVVPLIPALRERELFLVA